MKNIMTDAAADRIRKTAEKDAMNSKKKKFAERAQIAADLNASLPIKDATKKATVPNGPSKTGNKSGKNRGNNPPQKK